MSARCTCMTAWRNRSAWTLKAPTPVRPTVPLASNKPTMSPALVSTFSPGIYYSLTNHNWHSNQGKLGRHSLQMLHLFIRPLLYNPFFILSLSCILNMCWVTYTRCVRMFLSEQWVIFALSGITHSHCYCKTFQVTQCSVQILMSVRRNCPAATTHKSAPTPGAPTSVPVPKALGLLVLASLV